MKYSVKIMRNWIGLDKLQNFNVQQKKFHITYLKILEHALPLQINHNKDIEEVNSRGKY